MAPFRIYSRVSWLIKAIVIYLLISPSLCANKCLVHRDEVNPKRYIQFDGMNLNISLEASNRASHILATHIFKIFLQEVLGYVRVEIVHRDDIFDVENIFARLSGPLDERAATVPSSMVNLEVWVPPEENTMSLLDVYHVRECGSIAPPGRFGWFIPAPLAHSIRGLNKWWTEEMQDVQWTIFRDPVASSIFSIHKHDLKYIEKHAYKNYSSGEYYCDEPICQNGMYIPERCKKLNCALLLAPYYNVTKFVIEHINEMKLYVNVIWLGPNLKLVSDKLTQKFIKQNTNQSLIIFGWTPSAVISPEYNFIRVAFKRCELLNSSHTVGCKYEMNRLIKASWSKLEQIAKPAYEALHRITFSQDNYNDLLQQYNLMLPNQSIYEVACNWMITNEKAWQNWIPGTDRGKVNIYIGGIFPITGSSYTAKGIVLAARMAKEAINKNNSILENYNLNLLAHDGQCRADMVMKRFIDYIVHKYYENLVGVLGPACSETVEPLAGVSKHYKTLVISYSAEGASFSDRSKYPYFFRTIGENKQYILVYQYLLKKMGWTKIAALSEDGQKYTEYISHMQALLEKQGISFIANIKFPRERSKYSMKSYLEDLKRRRARIIIADVYDEVARSVMCEAYKLGMTAQQGYVWFLPSWLSSYWYNTSYYNQLFNETVNCTMDEMINAINGHFALTNAYFASEDAIMQENKTVGEWRDSYAAECDAQHMNMSNYAGYAYDAMWIFAMALDKLIKDDPESLADLHSYNTTMKLVTYVQETDFEGVSGRIKFHGGSSRFSVINIVQWVNAKTSIIGHFNPNISDTHSEVLNGILTLNETEITWLSPDGKKPDDGTEPEARCVFHNLAELLNVDCEIAVIVANIICFGLLGIIFVLSIFFWKRRYDKKVQLTQQYMKSLGLDFLNVTNMADLDKWEIPRDHVVINRKLGEGAFGTVYGGEAHFPEKGWVAVAVKTLKVGSTTEEKVDFLSEAEVMKRFEHKNIIRLLGVCTKSEPVYTVMEFMLYGDLKTFLLARRHLINKKNVEECEEISCKKLTLMALDVARALSYLAELKYVHRDVACRNCLVNAQRVVKLADFGMARPTFENDYYKFNRKGMLPVRWMSPESLSLGMFTTSSDVWAYGVFLYEMVTFGGFPYQGLSNYQVLEYVKQGHTIKIPRGVTPQLEGLIVSCWNRDPKKRPQASAIVEFLASNQRLLSPVIDVPATMPYDNPDQIETCFTDKPGKVSLCFTSPSEQFMNDIVTDGTCGVSFTPLQRTNSELSEI